MFLGFTKRFGVDIYENKTASMIRNDFTIISPTFLVLGIGIYIYKNCLAIYSILQELFNAKCKTTFYTYHYPALYILIFTS